MTDQTEAPERIMRNLDEALCNFLNGADDAYTPDLWHEETKRNASTLAKVYNEAHIAKLFPDWLEDKWSLVPRDVAQAMVAAAWNDGFSAGMFTEAGVPGAEDRQPPSDALAALDRVKAEARRDGQERIVELETCLTYCVHLLNETVKESGREVEYGEEDPFRRGEWFDYNDHAMITRSEAAIRAEAEREKG